MNTLIQESFGLTAEERQLRDSVEEFLHKNRLGDVGSWRQMVDLGWVGACVPEAVGGYAETGREALIISERLGAHGVAVPLAAAAYAPIRLLCVDRDVKERHAALIEKVASGDERLVIAWSESGRPFERVPELVAAEQVSGGWRLQGRKVAALGGSAANHAIVSAHANGKVALFLVGLNQERVEVRPYSILSGFESADLSFDDVTLSTEALIATGDKAKLLLDCGLDSAATAACSDMVGAIEKALSITEEYIRTRKQFGQSVASFQVPQHRLVEIAIDLEYSRSCVTILMNSAFIRKGITPAPAALAGARSEIMRRAQHAVADAVQLHGGIGMTEEAPISHYLKRVAALANIWGNSCWQLQQYRKTRTADNDLFSL